MYTRIPFVLPLLIVALFLLPQAFAHAQSFELVDTQSHDGAETYYRRYTPLVGTISVLGIVVAPAIYPADATCEGVASAAGYDVNTSVWCLEKISVAWSFNNCIFTCQSGMGGGIITSGGEDYKDFYLYTSPPGGGTGDCNNATNVCTLSKRTATPSESPWVDMGCGPIFNSYNATYNPTQEWVDITCQEGFMLQGRTVYNGVGSAVTVPGNSYSKEERRCIATNACAVTSNLSDLTALNYGPASGSTVTAGAISFSAGVTNTGSVAANGFNNIFQLSDGTVFSASSASVGPGATATFSASRTLATPGTYQYRGCADANTSWVGIISESNEANNCSPWTTFTVSDPTPTPTPTPPTPTPPTPTPTPPAPPLTADLVGTPLTVRSGQSAVLTWTSNADTCTGTGFNTQGAANNTVGVSTGPLTLTTCPSGVCNYQAICTRTIAKNETQEKRASEGVSAVAGTESVSDSVAITVVTPTVDLTVTPNRVKVGDTVQLSWTSSQVASCTGAGFSTGGAITGTSTSPAITTQTTFRITCDAGAATDSVIVNVVPRFEEF